MLISRETPELIKGTLDLLILKTLESGPLHGYGIARALEEKTGRALQIEEGSLYPALYRMTNRGWIDFEWGISPNNRRKKSYRLTSKGEKRLKANLAEWREFTAAVALVLEEGTAS
ncbi:MAG: PadR family transcriptional regulator [Myxococcota bacterium]|nr:PadR family transcriptional regulator [Myxococcota bacterium]